MGNACLYVSLSKCLNFFEMQRVSFACVVPAIIEYIIMVVRMR